MNKYTIEIVNNVVLVETTDIDKSGWLIRGYEEDSNYDLYRKTSKCDLIYIASYGSLFHAIQGLKLKNENMPIM